MIVDLVIVWVVYFAVSFPVNKFFHKASNTDAAVIASVAATVVTILTALIKTYLY